MAQPEQQQEDFCWRSVDKFKVTAVWPCVFDLVLDVMASDVREEVPWSALFADGIVLSDRTKQGVQLKVGRWRQALEDQGLKISKIKVEYLGMGEERRQGTVRLRQNNFKRVKIFKYLRSNLTENGDTDSENTHRIKKVLG
ncbi:uncharacterized protein [Macrobrachium rosenbergii]|uniref:uncharacterized protein n=1 Tax=Macrobrachium rosenbergii TaxID=79674 RepID=UPI0034D40AA8